MIRKCDEETTMKQCNPIFKTIPSRISIYANPNTSATLKILILAPHNPTKIATTSTTTSTVAPSIHLGLKIRYSMRCLLRCPAHIVVARLTTA